MAKSKWKFRQDDLDTILTVINQGLMKKPYWVEYHDTYEDGTPVWNGEKSVLWNLMEQAYPEERAQMMRRMLSKMEELGGLQKGTHQQKLFAFFEKYYFSVIDKFSSMLYNEDGKLYEKMKLAMLQGTYTNDTDPLGQSLGDGQSPEVAWVKKRIQYLQSKYSFGDYDAKTAEGAITVRTSAQADATTNSIVLRLTPAMKLYPTIAYGTTTIRGTRTDAGKTCEIVVDINGTSDQQLSVKSADYLLDIGDWSSYVINGTLSIIGKRLKRLKLGDQDKQKVKILISALTLGNTVSLEEIDIQNVTTLGGSLDMRGNYRLRKFLAGGSSLTEAHFADGGTLEEVDYPATTSYVELKNLDKLTNEHCNTATCAPNVMSYFVSGCDNLQPAKMLIDIMDAQVGQTSHALRYVRCVGFNETFTDGRAFDKLSQLVDGSYQGIDAEGQYGNDPYPVLDGTINLTTGAYRDTYDALMTHYPKLKLNIAKWWIRFEDPEVKRICVENWDKDGDGELSMEEAAAVSSIGTMHIPSGKKFNELRYFRSWNPRHGVTNDIVFFDDIIGEVTIPHHIMQVGLGWQIVFRSTTQVHRNIIIRFLGEMKEIGYWSIADDKRYRGEYFSLLLPNTPIPPIFNGRWVGETYGACKVIYVPDDSVEAYKAAKIPNVKEILPISEYHSNIV